MLRPVTDARLPFQLGIDACAGSTLRLSLPRQQLASLSFGSIPTTIAYPPSSSFLGQRGGMIYRVACILPDTVDQSHTSHGWHRLLLFEPQAPSGVINNVDSPVSGIQASRSSWTRWRPGIFNASLLVTAWPADSPSAPRTSTARPKTHSISATATSRTCKIGPGRCIPCILRLSLTRAERYAS